MDNKALNSETIYKELDWLSNLIDYRFEAYFTENTEKKHNISLPNLDKDNSIFALKLKKYSFNFLERLTIAIAIAPHIKPQILDALKINNKTYNTRFTEFGGVLGTNHNGFLPTGETVAFLYAGKDIQKRFEVSEMFSVDHIFHKNDLISLNETKANEPILSGQLIINNNFLELITIGYDKMPSFSKSFPAKEIKTNIAKNDLIIPISVQKSLENLNNWLQHSNNLDQSNYKIHKGYKALFYGPPGTGKTLTAGVIGKINNRKVLKVDLSQIQSKWVGETEKTLSKIFNKADNKGWILFFDEADAIFGKRSNVGSSNEQYANQTVSYLLQRIEDYNGMIILASNLKGNIDQAFIRRFQSIIHFTIPNAKLREKLWKSTFNEYKLDQNIDIKNLSKQYEFSGASINNIFNYCILQIIGSQKKNISKSILNEAIKYELRKEGRY